ncbi:MAG: TolC family protein [Rhizomicrobium sp.]
MVAGGRPACRCRSFAGFGARRLPSRRAALGGGRRGRLDADRQPGRDLLAGRQHPGADLRQRAAAGAAGDGGGAPRPGRLRLSQDRAGRLPRGARTRCPRCAASTSRKRRSRRSAPRLRIALVLATSRYREGYSPYLDQLDAERGLLSTELALVQARSDRLTAVVTLSQALGGGWNKPGSTD